MKKILAIVLTIIMLSLGVLTSSCKEEHVCEFKWEVVKESTCTEKGIAEIKCKNCEELFLVELETKEHNFVASNDGQKQVCTGCGKTENVSHPQPQPHQHPIIAVQEKSATCGTNGMKAHYYCEYCMSYFNDKEGKEATKKSALIIPATGEHVPGRDKPTELNGKWYHDLRCSKCAKTINAEPILCPDCGGWQLDMTNQPNAKCLNIQCGKEFSISLT